MKVLFVCTANVCRSVSAAALMYDGVQAWGLRGIEIASAGSYAESGAPACQAAPALQGRAQTHSSTPLDAPMIAAADLILTAARENQQGVTALDASARNRTFTIRQAGRLAQWLTESGMIQAARWRAQQPMQWEARFLDGDPRQAVAPFPTDEQARARWLVEELDAARGIAPTVGPANGTSTSIWRRSSGGPANEDIVDPHVDDRVDFGRVHQDAYQQIWQAVNSLVYLLRQVQDPVEVTGALANQSSGVQPQ